MTHETEHAAPVLIAGAGPAGLTAAIALARQGIESLVVERKRELSSLPRATVISTRSMELLRSWGLEQEIKAGGVEVEWQMLSCESLALASAGSAIPVGLPSREQSAVVSPAAPECVPQDHTEQVLLDHARSLAPARVELGTEVVGLENGPDGTRVVLRAAGGGPARAVHARYVIAADGAHSTVRSALGIAMHGPDGGRRAAAEKEAPPPLGAVCLWPCSASTPSARERSASARVARCWPGPTAHRTAGGRAPSMPCPRCTPPSSRPAPGRAALRWRSAPLPDPDAESLPIP